MDLSRDYPTLLAINSSGEASNNWICIGNADGVGLLPAVAGQAGNGHSFIGTSNWYWKRLYVDEIYSNQLIFKQPDIRRTDGIYGTYDYTKAATIWSMGTDYKIAADGSTFGNLYGAAYAYEKTAPTGTTNILARGHQFVWCQNGTACVALGYHVWSTTTNCSWVEGQRDNKAAYNVSDMTNTGSYWPWMRGTNTSSKKWFSLGVLNNSFYIMGSATTRTENSYDYCWHIWFEVM